MTVWFVRLFPLFLTLVAPGALALESPGTALKKDVAQVLSVLRDKSLDTSVRRARLNTILDARFDVEAMAQRILAVNWSETTTYQRQRFVQLFKGVLQDTYLAAMESYTTETVRVGGERIQGDRATVIVTIMRRDGTDIPLLFKLRRGGNGWLAYDANIEGVSLVSTYRGRFAEIVNNQGMDGLLDHMARRNEQLPPNV